MQAAVNVSPARFVTIELASVVTGLTPSAIRTKIAKSVWVEGRESLRAGQYSCGSSAVRGLSRGESVVTSPFSLGVCVARKQNRHMTPHDHSRRRRLTKHQMATLLLLEDLGDWARFKDIHARGGSVVGLSLLVKAGLVERRDLATELEYPRPEWRVSRAATRHQLPMENCAVKFPKPGTMEAKMLAALMENPGGVTFMDLEGTCITEENIEEVVENLRTGNFEAYERPSAR